MKRFMVTIGIVFIGTMLFLFSKKKKNIQEPICQSEFLDCNECRNRFDCLGR